MSGTRPNIRGKDVKKMNKPYTGRVVYHTCSNGWTIERVIPEEFGMEAFFMGHCLSGSSCGINPEQVYSLREPDGTPHATITLTPTGWELTGRCNQPPKESYATLIREWPGLAS